MYAIRQGFPKLFNGAKLEDTDYEENFKQQFKLQKLLADVKDFYPDDFDPKDYTKLGGFIDELYNNKTALTDYVTSVRRLKILDSVQAAAPFTKFRFIWVTLSPKVNQKDYPIYDPGNVANMYTKTVSDYYFSLAGTLDFLWSYKNSKLFFYPGLAIQNARIYNSSDSLSISIQKPLTPGVDSIQSIKTTGFYPKVADRHWVYALTLPIMYYWNKGYGIDAGIGYKIQPAANDFSARIGFFFTVPTAGGQTLTLEPLVKYDNDQSQTYAKNFDKFSLGFSVSLSIPTFISGTSK